MLPAPPCPHRCGSMAEECRVLSWQIPLLWQWPLPSASQDKWHSLSLSQQPCLSPEALLCAHHVTSTRYASSNNPNPSGTKCPVTRFLSGERRVLALCRARGRSGLVKGCRPCCWVPAGLMPGWGNDVCQGLAACQKLCFHKEVQADATKHKRG